MIFLFNKPFFRLPSIVPLGKLYFYWSLGGGRGVRAIQRKYEVILPGHGVMLPGHGVMLPGHEVQLKGSGGLPLYNLFLFL